MKPGDGMMKVECKINGLTCDLPNFMVQLISKTSFMYCGTIDANRKPHIQPIIFINDKSKCTITFLVNNKSDMKINLKRNPNVSLTIDETHPTNPFWNRGIMIKAITQLSDIQKDVQECFEELQYKYSSNTVIKILGFDVIEKYTRFRASPLKIIYWKGPYFKQFRCKHIRKKKFGKSASKN